MLLVCGKYKYIKESEMLLYLWQHTEISLYAKAGCMQCYSALTVIPKRPVVMPITEVSMKTPTGFMKNKAEVVLYYCVLVCGNGR